MVRKLPDLKTVGKRRKMKQTNKRTKPIEGNQNNQLKEIKITWQKY
jgi:hypothetical protein